MRCAKRRASLLISQRIHRLHDDRRDSPPRLNLHCYDLSGSSNLTRILRKDEPDVVESRRAEARRGLLQSAGKHRDVDAMVAPQLPDSIGFPGPESKTRH